MRLISTASPQEIIRTLELRSWSPASFAKRHEESEHALRTLVIDPPRVLKERGLEDVGIQNDWDLEQLVLASKFREWVEEWLDTGRNADGSESPSKRNVFHTVNAIRAVTDCAAETPMRLLLDRETSQFVVTFDTEPARLELPLNFQFCGPFERGLSEARRLFTCLMASDWKESICKCRHVPCARYFFLNKPRNSYRHGTFCSREHQSHASADACTRAQRTGAQLKLIEAAARQLLDWRIGDAKWQSDANLKRLLAKELCHVIATRGLHGFRQDVKLNWVTWNAKKIEQKRLEFFGGLSTRTQLATC